MFKLCLYFLTFKPLHLRLSFCLTWVRKRGGLKNVLKGNWLCDVWSRLVICQDSTVIIIQLQINSIIILEVSKQTYLTYYLLSFKYLSLFCLSISLWLSMIDIEIIYLYPSFIIYSKLININICLFISLIDLKIQFNEHNLIMNRMNLKFSVCKIIWETSRSTPLENYKGYFCQSEFVNYVLFSPYF